MCLRSIYRPGCAQRLPAARFVSLIRPAKRPPRPGDHPSTVTGLAFNPKGKRLAVSHYGGVTLRWTGKLDQGAAHLQWRGSHIGVTWSPDGTTVLTAMQERELHGLRLTDRHDMSMPGYAAKVRSIGIG